jgi:hypothetical protein
MDVVAVKGDIELPERQVLAAALGHEVAQALGDGHAAGVNADERHRAQVLVSLDQLVRDPRERPTDCLVVEQDS